MLGYNRMSGYNKARYNADGFELSDSNTITITDNVPTKLSSKSFADLITMQEAQAKQQNKGVVDSLRLDEWVSINEDESNPWSD